MDSKYSIRKAQLEDSKFLAEAIISAEKSNSDKLSLSTFFNLEEEKVEELVIAILDEEIEGCEFQWIAFWLLIMRGRQ